MTEQTKQPEVNVEATEATGMSYADFVRPLVTELSNAIVKVQGENEDKYNEFDVYNALALSITMLVSRNVPNEDRDLVNKQSIVIANEMTDKALEVAQKDQSFLSAILVGSSRAVTNLVELIETNVQAQNEQAEAQAEEE